MTTGMINGKRILTAGALAAMGALLMAGPAGAADKGAPKWGYSGPSGPSAWAKLHPNNKICATGKRQSPFHIRTAKAKSEPAGTFHYKATAGEVVNKGYTLQVNLAKDSYITVDGKRYTLVQFHFHTPSEHRLNGRHYPMELHLVHASEDGKLAVVGVMIDGGGFGNHPLDKLPVPDKAGGKVALPGGAINPATLLPKQSSHFRFEGSLTTPPCTEGVKWHMMATPIRVEGATLVRFTRLMGKNNRPLQPANDRVITHHK